MICLIKQVSLKSRGSSARRHENKSENDPDDVINDANGTSILAGKYSLYRPRPGKNLCPTASTQTGTDIDGHGPEMNQFFSVNGSNAAATCPPNSELTFVYDNVDQARIARFLSFDNVV